MWWKRRKKLDPEHLANDVFEPQTEEQKKCFICPPECTARKAVSELRAYFLGDNWYVDFPGSDEQIIAEIVWAIEANYRGAWYTPKKKV